MLGDLNKSCVQWLKFWLPHLAHWQASFTQQLLPPVVPSEVGLPPGSLSCARLHCALDVSLCCARVQPVSPNGFLCHSGQPAPCPCRTLTVATGYLRWQSWCFVPVPPPGLRRWKGCRCLTRGSCWTRGASVKLLPFLIASVVLLIAPLCLLRT